MTQAPNDDVADASVTTSRLLQSLGRGEPDQRVTVSEVLSVLGDRVPLFAMLLLALPNTVPGPPIPGLSTITGLPLAIIALQLVFGRRKPWVPGWIGRRNFSRGNLAAFARAATPLLRRMESLLRPRWPNLVSGSAERAMGALCFALGAMLLPPLPFVTIIPALAIVLISLAMIARDGAAVMVAGVIGMVVLSVLSSLLFLGVDAVT